MATLATTALSALTPEMTLDSRSLARRALSGEATYYDGNVKGGACSFSTYTIPSGLYGTAISDANWDGSGSCGGCVAVTYGGKTIQAMVVDECPGCGTNHLDLFPDGFGALADKSKGVINVNWDWIACPITSPLVIHMKSGVSAYWFSAQVVNGKRRTAKLEASVDGGKTWKSTQRKDYNFYEISSGVGASTAWIRVTSNTGTTVTVKNVSMTGDAVATATANYS